MGIHDFFPMHVLNWQVHAFRKRCRGFINDDLQIWKAYDSVIDSHLPSPQLFCLRSNGFLFCQLLILLSYGRICLLLWTAHPEKQVLGEDRSVAVHSNWNVNCPIRAQPVSFGPEGCYQSLMVYINTDRPLLLGLLVQR